MRAVRSGKIIRDRISPCTGVTDTIDIVVDQIEYRVDIVAGIVFAVHILHDQFRIGVAGTTAHTCHRSVNDNFAESLCHVDKFL